MLGDRLDVVLRDGSAARNAARARRSLESLRDELDSAVYLASYDRGEIVILEIVDSPKSPRIDLWVGIHDAAHATALGKCILSQLDGERREAYLAGTRCTTSPRTRWSIAGDCRRSSTSRRASRSTTRSTPWASAAWRCRCDAGRGRCPGDRRLAAPSERATGATGEPRGGRRAGSRALTLA